MDKAEKVSFVSGQRAKSCGLTFDRLNKGELAVLRCLRRFGAKMKIRQIVENNGWDKPCKVKGNSKVRNALRRLVREKMVLHDKEIGDGTYFLPEDEDGSVDIEPVINDIKPVSIKKDLNLCSPHPITGNEIVEVVKRSDCTFYNACLDQAISGKWAGFACTSCNAYSEPDAFQKTQNHLGLRAVQTAAELVEKHGKVNRIRGVKPGADAKRRIRLAVVETVSLSEALEVTD